MVICSVNQKLKKQKKQAIIAGILIHATNIFSPIWLNKKKIK